jgi:hypothetical protein
MSAPRKFIATDRSASSYASMELMGVSSSLHMPADPVLPTDPDYRDPREYSDYLTDTDRMVRHAHRHLQAAIQAVSADRHLLEHLPGLLDLAVAKGETFTSRDLKKLQRQIYALYTTKGDDHASSDD